MKYLIKRNVGTVIIYDILGELQTQYTYYILQGWLRMEIRLICYYWVPLYIIVYTYSYFQLRSSGYIAEM